MSELLPHQQRVVDEKTELGVKIEALSKFIDENPVFDTLDPVEQDLLVAQHAVMWAYSNILSDRIEAFSA